MKTRKRKQMKTDNSAKKVNSVKKERREKKEKLTIEKRILQLSFLGSVLFIVAEGVMAWFTHSHSLWTDCLFDAADLVMIGPFLVLVPLLYKPVTEKHPYGYAQVESLFLLVKYSVLLALTCNLMVENIKLLLHGGHEVDAGSIAIFANGKTIIYDCTLSSYHLVERAWVYAFITSTTGMTPRG